MYDSGTLLAFAALLLATDAVVKRVQDLAAQLGRRIAAICMRLGALEADPLSGRIQMKKWQEQSWQMFVHIGFTVMEMIILRESPQWWADPRTCWIPHPRDQGPLHSPMLRFFYLAQLSVWIYTCFVHRSVTR
jgi:hypothetical protein